MLSFKDAPIKTKLTVLSLVTTGAALLLAGLAFIVTNLVFEWKETVHELSVTTKVIGANTRSAILFNDRKNAEYTLSALRLNKKVGAAVVYTAEGRLFAKYIRDKEKYGIHVPAAPGPSGHFYKEGYITETQDISLDNDKVGSIYILFVLDELRNLAISLITIGFIVLLISVIAAFLIWSRLQLIITKPIEDLASAISDVSNTHNYTVRVEKSGEDEMGTLIGGFNEMLAQIQNRDMMLEQHTQQLEEKVAERTGELRQANELLEEELMERKWAERELRLAANVYENAVEGIMVTDANAVIQSVNNSFTGITGYSADEVIGKNPNILQSGRHDKEFYEKMWESLLTTGRWQGEIWDRRKNREAYPQRITITAIRDSEGQTIQYASIFYDITEIKQSEKEIEYRAYHDALTGLPNRQLFYDRLEQAICRAKRGESFFAVLFIDVDNFKDINDRLGHAVGDLLLQGMAVRLIDCSREEDTVSRQGGDEFTIIVENIVNEQEAATVASRVIESLLESFNHKGDELHTTVSIGIAVFPINGETAEDLMKNADMAMYSVKDLGKNNYRFFTPEMNEKIVRRHELERNLRKAIDNNEMVAYYQPKVDIKSGRIVGMEALIRWNWPGHGLVPPFEFIPIAEETGLVVELDEWMICAACDFIRKMHEDVFKGGHETPVKVSVNLSAREIERPELIESITKIIERYELQPLYIDLEVTESSIVRNIDQAIKTLQGLQDAGFSISIDDFGTGYSSLNYLAKFPINTLKIDKTFIDDLEMDKNARSITKAITAMAHELNFTVVAEGVETKGQLDFLRHIGCDQMQGYLFSRPVPAEEMEQLLKDGKTLSLT